MARQIIAEISISDLTDPLTPSNATVTRVEHLASYNWLDKSVPTISVPGSPPLWSPPSVPEKLLPDSGLVYIDQNAARNPSSPLEPLFRALYTQNPNFEIEDVDLVTDRNNVRKLLRFVKGSSSEAFKIQVEIACSKTALFIRMEDKPKEMIQDFRGFGHNFEDKYTEKQTEGTGHHRVISYHFGGMRCIIRHETDGCVKDISGPTAITKAAKATDSLSDMLGTLSLASPDPASSHLPSIIVKAEGKVVDMSSTLEIKTRAATRKLDFDEVYSQLWISQTPNLVTGFHQHGLFHDVRLRNVKQAIHNWEVTNLITLNRLACLMKRIITVVNGSSSSNALVEYDGGMKLKIITVEQKRTLPDDLYSKWEEAEGKQK